MLPSRIFPVALFAAALAIQAQAPDAARMKADVDTLASSTFEGRRTGTPGQMKAARLVESRFQELGLQPLGAGADPWFLPYDLELRATAVDGSSLSLGDRRAPYGPGLACWRLAPLETELIFLPDSVVKDPQEAGHWVARFAPHGFKTADADRLLDAASDTGASGLLLLPRPGNDELAPLRERGRAFIQRGRYGFPKDKDSAAPKGPPLAALDDASAKALGLDLLALMRLDHPLDLGALRIAPNATVTRVPTTNVAAMILGHDPVLKDEVVILSAHQDHLGIRDGKMYPGADDNASGTSVLMEVARLLKDAKPRRSVLFLSVSGEELGLFGSRAFVAHPPFPLKRIVADLNTDMVGRNDVRTISVTPARIEGATGTLTRDTRTIAAKLGLTLTREADEYWARSDHYTFAQAGIPSIFFFGGMEPDYHAPTDTPDKIEPEKLVNVAELLRDLTLSVANAGASPSALPEATWKTWTWPSN